ncbi:alkaline phosphatase [Mucilaginibacter myungsuensis]|uniref:Alkaline phosphatase n=1 Tax=Mucilaginibacter myungsuensis TaxID=649104 RepID=A0A929PWC5_9SPHI|nr:alkaline phosphatase [Mucilaginibacter myungsuensis]MBE9661220.1 alkaline phosphatase [Mucilaginibacter myungsuensis]MDN3597364.1 alkaline phosphatase [Mucilaginibacter myungsuensis]
MFKRTILTALATIFVAISANAQSLRINQGHSHNDYHQNIPLLQSYYAGMGSIEADVFLQDGKLYVAHDKKEIEVDKTLDRCYLKPLAELFKKNGNRAYADPKYSLQLIVDIKENHIGVIAELIKELAPYPGVFDGTARGGIKLVLSGDMPVPANFNNFPAYIYYDGRPYTTYTADQLKRVAMISDALPNYTKWNGKGTPTPTDLVKLKDIVMAAHKKGKPFRFWATQDSPNTWIELEKIGVDWINTDHPQDLTNFLKNRAKLEYVNPTPYALYTPTYKSDGANKKVKNVILLIGDGMGLAQIQAGLTANHGQLNIYQCRNIGFSQTRAANSDNTDSAAGATAMATGQKTNNRYIGMDPQGRPLTNLPDILAKDGIKSGIISAGNITDATPACFYAHVTERDSMQMIARDLLNSKIDLLIGSGAKYFQNNKDKALVQKLADKQFRSFTSLADAESVKTGKQLILLPDADTRRMLDGRGDMLGRSLKHGIEVLSKNKKGFFVMAEGAQIDHGGHANDLPFVITELHDFDKTVAEALKFADQDGETLVIITADHETGGLTLLDASTEKGSVLTSFSTNDHTSINVPVFAYGPHSQDFTGTYQNTEIFKKILALITGK